MFCSIFTSPNTNWGPIPADGFSGISFFAFSINLLWRHSIHLNLHSIFYNQTPEHARKKSGLIGRTLEQGQEKKGGRQNWSALINCRGNATILWTLWMSRLCMRDCHWCPFSKSFLWRVTDTFWHHLSSSSITPCCQYITPTSLISLFLLNALLSNITALFILAWGKDRGWGGRGGGTAADIIHTLLLSRWYDRSYCMEDFCLLKLPVLPFRSSQTSAFSWGLCVGGGLCPVGFRFLLYRFMK